ncbi:MAG: hypothetical protein AAF363_16665 [Bacteroidota bacterium]
MSMITNELVLEAEKYTIDLLQIEMPDGLTYHNYKHTILVVDGVRIIGVSPQ